MTQDTSSISTHVLDTGRGRPAAGVPVTVDARDGTGGWKRVGQGTTDADGRLRVLLLASVAVGPGTYRLRFDTGAYFNALEEETFFPEVIIVFEMREHGHHHVPLLLNRFGYSTYRGS